MRQVPWAFVGLVTLLPALGCGNDKVQEQSGSFVFAETHGEIHPGDVAMDDKGRFFVVWGDHQEGAVKIYGRLYAANGDPISEEMAISSSDLETQYASVRMNDKGETIVAFSAEDHTGAYQSRFRRFDAQGRPMGEDQIVFGSAVRPDVEFLADGGFVVTDSVAFASNDLVDGIQYEAHLRRFFPDGRPQGHEFILVSPSTQRFIDSSHPHVRASADGGFSVVWSREVGGVTESPYDAPYYGSFARRFDANGRPSAERALQLEGQANLEELRSLQNRFVLMPSGNIALLARAYEYDDWGTARRRRATLQLLTADGAPIAPAIELQSLPEPADILGQDLGLMGCESAAGCSIVATWTSVPVNHPDQVTVFARVFDTNGQPRRSPLSPTAAEIPLGLVRDPSAYPYIGANRRGDLVLVWRQTGGSGDPSIERIDGLLFPGFADALAP